MQTFRRSLALVAVLTLAAGSAPAQAQEVDAQTTAAARALFDQGMEAVDAGDHQRGADLFARSIALRDSPVTRTNLALALIEIGHLVTASEHLRAAIRMSRPDSRVRILAMRFLEELRPRLGELRIAVTGHPERTEVLLDDEPVPEALVGVEQPVDPGEHTVVLRRGETVLTEQTVRIRAGRTAAVTLVARAMTDAERAALEGSEGSSDDGGGGGVETEAWFWVLIAALVLGAAGGITAGVLVANPPDPQYELGDSGNTHTTLLEVRF